MAMSCGGPRGVRADINMTPMIDVLLVLIIIFMVITPTVSTGLDASIPQAPEAGPVQPAPSHDIVVSVLADGTLRLNQEAIARADLEGRLAAIYQHAGNAPVFIRGDRQVDYRLVAEVIDMAHSAGIGRIGLMGN
ncbi:MAG TPA: biopolymer transporter ExbD [Candidatus Sulfopaludibacter sp.]|nr:biopolymer transporter ExbD [Candidatus Sulfopaludibacter sp.]